MIEEHDQVVLTRDLPEHGLIAGDVAAVIAAHQNGSGYTLEFATLRGETIAIVTVEAQDVRPARERELAHVRPATQ